MILESVVFEFLMVLSWRSLMQPPLFRSQTSANSRGFSAFLLLLSSCSGADAGDRFSATPEAERYGGAAIVAIGADVKTLYPLYFQDGLAIHINKDQLFTPLVRYDSLLRAQPFLAARWDTVRVDPDSIELTVHLRTDVF